MFKLQRLEITGFKSFADYTEIVFTGNGITAVVGPNGCGKSNVSDSISWVLGEQRAKSLRGGEMKDVVFQGTKNRKPSGMAEVVLHLVRDEDAFDVEENELEDIDEALSEIDENAVDMNAIEPGEPVADSAVAVSAEVVVEELDGSVFETETVRAAQVGSIETVQTRVTTKRHWRPRSFALDFAPGEAVSVTRRLYLSGESEYQLNGKTCRLRDIQDLFAGTGLSGSHYAIIEQGRIGQILSAKPGDRRNLIEEAAGISKFRTRQRAAETRLETAKTNLGRVSDIVSEIEKQVNSLRRQAAKTRRFKILQEEFRVLLRNLFTAEGRFLTAHVQDLIGMLTEASEKEQELVAEVAAKEDAVRNATKDARAAEAELADIRRRHAENALERDRAERDHHYKAEQIVNLNNRGDAIRAEISSTEQRLQSIDEEHATLGSDEARERDAAGKAEMSLREAEDNHRQKVELLAGIESELEIAREELYRHISAGERFAEIGRQVAGNLEKLDERLASLRRESVRADQSHRELIDEAGKFAEQIRSEREKLASLDSEKHVILNAANSARESLRVAEDEQRALADEHSARRHRLMTLRELEDKRAVYVPQVQKLFEKEAEIGVNLLGVLADRITVHESAEKAVENLFGSYLQAILVASDGDAKKLSAWLRSNAIGRVAILVVPDISGPVRQPLAVADGLKIEHVIGTSPDLADLLRSVFPREMSAVISRDVASASAGEILVSTAGDLSIGGSMVVSGDASPGEKNSSVLAFKRELQTLGHSVERLAGDLEAASARSAEARLALAEKEEQVVDLQSLMIKIERGLHGLEIQESAARQEIERAERHRRVVADEIVQAENEVSELASRRDEALRNAESAAISQARAKSDLEAISNRSLEARQAAESAGEILNEKRMAAATSDERRRSAASALRRIENEEKDLRARLAVLHLELSENDEKIRNLRESVYEISDRIAAAGSEKENEALELAAAIELLESTRKAADAISEELAASNHQAAEARNHRADIEIRQAESVTRLKNINEKCFEELGVSLATLVDDERIEISDDLDWIRTEANDLRQKLDNFGAINMLALEELGEAEERLLFLTSQRQDIIDGMAAAEEALREIKERSREKFKKAFESINANFTTFFQELFGGGRGEMTLLESDDVLEAGIEVVAQPPGKRLQNILLLSGGEKAMTAIALVLAIFKYRPSPFCLLDEVDAPLDDANVGRFVNKIAEMSEKTQFIVITHNKRTMEAARALYGVTMQEAGVSKVVSVKFE